MKRLTCCLFFCSLIALQAFAQSDFGYGVKLGLNIATQKTSDEGLNVDTKSLLGFHAGGYGNYFFSELFAIQAELLFSQKGSKWSDPYFSGKDRLCYLDIPVLFRYQPLEYLNVHAGPQFGFLLRAKQIPDDGDKTDAGEYYKGTDIGLAFGVEGNLPHRINITLRYILGLSVITSDIEYIDEWKNNVFQISFGYRLSEL